MTSPNDTPHQRPTSAAMAHQVRALISAIGERLVAADAPDLDAIDCLARLIQAHAGAERVRLDARKWSSGANARHRASTSSHAA